MENSTYDILLVLMLLIMAAKGKSISALGIVQGIAIALVITSVIVILVVFGLIR